MVKITGVNFTPNGKIYYFSPGKNSDKYQKGAGVIVETARGHEYATIVIPLKEVEDDRVIAPLKPVLRLATPKDLETIRRNRERKPEAMRTAQELIAKHKLNMKLIDCDFAFDGAKVVFFYSSPSRVDFRELLKDLSAIFKMRIELRQIGIRDEIKMIGGLGPCGRECCCSAYMPDIRKVSIKMAKTQNLSLNPTKISGMCGRLMCCLAYENDYYAEAGKQVPKVGAEVTTPEGKGIVVNVNMLKMECRVKIEDKKKDIITFHDYPVKDIKFKRSERQTESNDADVEEQNEIFDKN